MTGDERAPGYGPGLRILLMIGGVILAATSCAPSPPGGGVPAASAAPQPEWRTGDQWFHAWSTGIRKGTKVSEFLGTREMGGVRYYVLRVETSHWFYTMDLRWAMQMQGSRVLARADPPQPLFLWPLEVGKSWEHRGLFEAQDQKIPMRETRKVVGIERVDVPAGVFRAFKIVRTTPEGDSDEYWYAPDVRWYVKWIGKRGKEQFEEVLQEYFPAGAGRRSGTP